MKMCWGEIDFETPLWLDALIVCAVIASAILWA